MTGDIVRHALERIVVNRTGTGIDLYPTPLGIFHLDVSMIVVMIFDTKAFPNVKIRSAVKELGNLKPDAHIRTPDGKILIVDSKFVYDTYNEIQAAPSTEGVGEKTVERLNTQLRNEVKGHVNKIRSDYVHPGKGTHEVAYMYIPSMAVYEYLIEHESATVRWAASQGVVICSPVNLMANMYMLEIVRMAQNMASLHNEILDAHLRVQKSFQAFEVEYKRLNTHIDNAFNKKTDLTGLVTKMDSEIRGLSSLAKSIESGSSGQSPKLDSVDRPGEHSADKQLA